MSTLRTINAVELVYGTDDPEHMLVDDPAEAYHEASKLYRSRALRQTDAYIIESNPNALVSTLRSSKRIKHLPRVALPPPEFPDVSLGTLLMRRRSSQTFSGEAIALQQLATVLFAAHGVTKRVSVHGGAAEQLFRTAPSGGALFPLDVYVAVHRVDGLEPAIYYYDSPDHALVRVWPHNPTRVLAEACIYPKAVDTSAATLLLSAAFWRSRFKYRLRAYRFTVLEAGHIAQNALLAANALGLGALPLGGFFEADIDRLLNNDGVNEAILYSVGVGVR
jgi:SagB-type dehydrogenase family enzyme